MTKVRKIRLLTTKQVGDGLGLSPRTIARWCREGRVTGAKKYGRVWRIREDWD